MKNVSASPTTCKTPRGAVVGDHTGNGRGAVTPRHQCGSKLRRRFWQIREALQQAYNVKLPRISFCGKSRRSAENAIQKWTVRNQFARCEGGRRERAGLRMAIALVKRGFPDPCPKCTDSTGKRFREFKREQGTPVAPVERKFLDFVVEKTAELFPRGWLRERRWDSHVVRSQVSTSASARTPRSKGGMRLDLTRDEYLTFLEGPERPILEPFKYADVVSAGKQRGVTLQSPAMALLRPLHDAMFDNIAKCNWLLKGPPTSSAFARAGFSFREGLLSGDYKSATNRLSLEVSHAILSVVLGNASGVPEHVRSLALASLSPVVQFEREQFIVRRGQMMGSYLSFPLLCVYNRLATLYALGPVPMLINGDDLVAETSDPSPWHELLPSLGLEPESRKTTYASRACNINSTAIVVQRRRAVIAKTLRMRALVPPSDVDAAGLGERFRSFVSQGPRPVPSARAWLTNHGRLLHGYISRGVSLGQMGFRVGDLGLLPDRVVGAALYHARRHHRPTDLPPPPRDSSHRWESEPDVIRVPQRNMTRAEKAAVLIENLEHPHALFLGDTRRLTSGWWVESRVRENCRRGSPIPARFRRLVGNLERYTGPKMYFGHFCDSRTFLARNCAPAPKAPQAVPTWHSSWIGPKQRTFLRYPFKGVEGRVG